MNRHLLIDALVEQTMVLIAQLATTGGARAPLAKVANQIFLNLSNELKQHGVGRKIIADMFGLSLRAYHAKVRRLSESVTERHRTLWEAMVDYLGSRPAVSRTEVLRRFRRDDDATVVAVLNDLVQTGLVYRTGEGPTSQYRLVAEEETPATDDEGLAEVVAVVLHRSGPSTLDQLCRALPSVSRNAIASAVNKLRDEGRITEANGSDGEPTLRCDSCVIPLEAAHGWEAAIFDHFQALATTIATKAQSGQTCARRSDLVGGSTYHFDIDEAHPLRERVMGLLQDVRERASQLREEVDAVNAGRERSDNPFRITFYCGQNVLDDGAAADDAADDDAAADEATSEATTEEV